ACALLTQTLSQPFVLNQFPDGFAIHGVGGDGVLVFAVQPSASPTRAPGVHVSLPLLGQIAEVTPPPEGWGTPLSIKIETFAHEGLKSSGQFLLMDNRVPPALAGTQATRIYRYGYSFTSRHGFTSTLLETHTLPQNIIYAGSIALLPFGRVAITDNA